jgi:hypothetical protein
VRNIQGGTVGIQEKNKKKLKSIRQNISGLSGGFSLRVVEKDEFCLTRTVPEKIIAANVDGDRHSKSMAVFAVE